MLMALGLYVFGMQTLPYQQLQRQISWRHPSSSRVNARPARQFVGKGDEIITLSGVLYPEITGGRISLAALEAMADEGMAWPLIEGTGWHYGLFVVEELATTSTALFPDGAARKIEFSIKLARTDDEPSLLGTVGNDLLTLLDLK
ncbi:phage tail protein [Dechloromonas denitrificans]|nr:phage tail protein [Dechloromonas denitrificans]